MVNPEWGTKRTCPKCSTRFYDLAKDDPVTCINCGNAWLPEPVLKSKQPLPFEAAQPEQAVKEDEDLAADELARAYTGAGREIFADQDPRYLEFLATRMAV